MSANICWEPVNKKSKSLPTSAPSAFMDSIREAFDREFPARFNGSDIPVLKGMATVFRTSEKDNPYLAMIKAIEKYEEIEVWAEY